LNEESSGLAAREQLTIVKAETSDRTYLHNTSKVAPDGQSVNRRPPWQAPAAIPTMLEFQAERLLPVCLPGLAAQPELLGQLAARLRVIGGHQRVISGRFQRAR